MARAFLPFLDEFHTKLKDGSKTATTRSKAYGAPGDVVDSPIGPLRLLEVRKAKLCDVRDHHWREEGVDSPQGFVDIWNRIHPKRGFNGDDERFLHLFERL